MHPTFCGCLLFIKGKKLILLIKYIHARRPIHNHSHTQRQELAVNNVVVALAAGDVLKFSKFVGRLRAQVQRSRIHPQDSASTKARAHNHAGAFAYVGLDWMSPFTHRIGPCWRSDTRSPRFLPSPARWRRAASFVYLAPSGDLTGNSFERQVESPTRPFDIYRPTRVSPQSSIRIFGLSSIVDELWRSEDRTIVQYWPLYGQTTGSCMVRPPEDVALRLRPDQRIDLPLYCIYRDKWLLPNDINIISDINYTYYSHAIFIFACSRASILVTPSIFAPQLIF
jgi:hypothetical protein